MAYQTPASVFADDQQGPGASQITFTPTTAPTIGNTVVVFARANNQTSSTMTASGWTRGPELGGATTPGWVWFFRRVLNSGGSPDFTSIVVDYSTAPSNYDLSWQEFSGTSITEDQAVTTTTGTGTSATIGTQTPTIAAVLALTGVSMSGAVSAPSSTQGFTQRAIGSGATDRIELGYKVITDGSATGSPVVSWTTSRTYRGVMVLLRADPAESFLAPSPRPRRVLMRS